MLTGNVATLSIRRAAEYPLFRELNVSRLPSPMGTPEADERTT